MRVALDTNGLFTGQAGIARHIRGLLDALIRHPQHPDIRPFAWEVPNFEYRQPTRGFKTLYREILWARTVAPWRLKAMQADIYHATGSFFVSVPSRLKCVVTLHDLAMRRHPERFRTWQRWSETRRLRRLHSADRIICISRFTADEAIELLGLPSAKIEVIYNGGDFQSRKEPIPERRPDFPVPSEFFLFVGSLEPGKNLALLKEVYQLAAKTGKTLPPLLIIGARWAGVGTEGKPPEGWHYLGRQPDEYLVYLYHRALALVFPSKYEGFGLPLVESMALGCPVICSPVASLPEVGGKAVCWSEMTPPAYLTAMSELAANAALREDLRAAGVQQAARFTWEKAADEVVRLYQSL